MNNKVIVQAVEVKLLKCLVEGKPIEDSLVG
jgi:hypothetical protein